MDTQTQHQNIELACHALFINYARYVDFGQYDDFVALFTEDAVLNLGFKMEGVDKIRASMSRRPDELRSRHVLTNISIDVDSEETASGIAYLTLYRHVGAESLKDEAVMLKGPAGVGHYSNTFRRTGQGWKISSCTLQFAFRDPDHFPKI